MAREYEDILTIATPEGVDLELTLAGVGSRFVSAIVDSIIQTVLLIALTIVLVSSNGFGSFAERPGLAAAAYAIATFAVIWGYDVLWEVLGGGRTPGKRLNGLRVVRDGGQPITFVPSAIRNILRFVDLLPGAYLVGIVSVLVTKKNQRLGDLAAGTLVVRERHAADVRLAKSASPVSAVYPRIDTTAITKAELAAIKAFLDRRHEIDVAARRDLARTLVQRLAPKVRGAPPELRGEAFLEAIAASRSSRGGE